MSHDEITDGNGELRFEERLLYFEQISGNLIQPRMMGRT
jgi:hypothetical protein